MPSETEHTQESPSQYRRLSPAEKDRLNQQVKLALESHKPHQAEQGAYLDSNPPRRPTVEEARLMSLCGVKSLEDLELAMSSPLSEEWLVQQNPEDRQALEDWYQSLSQEKDQ